MRKSLFIFCIIAVFLVFGVFLAGCAQNQNGSQTHTTTNAVPTPASKTGVQAPASTETTAPVTYNISVTVTRTDPSTITITYQGGPSAPSLQYLNILSNGINVGSMNSPSGHIFLPVGLSQTLAVPVPSHIVIYGHFLNGVQEVFDQTL